MAARYKAEHCRARPQKHRQGKHANEDEFEVAGNDGARNGVASGRLSAARLFAQLGARL